MIDRRRTRAYLAAAVASTAAIVIGVSGAWAVIGGGTAPATFAVTLDGELVQTAKGYALDGALVSGKKEYTLRISLQLTGNAAPAQSFQSGQTFATARVELLAGNLTTLRSYTLANAAVVAYEQSGDAATNAFTQELTLRSRTLTIG